MLSTAHKVYKKYFNTCFFPILTGLVERSNRTVEDCIKKIIVSQEDWGPMLSSVLFALRVSRHSLTGLFPYRVLYQRDPILPFQYIDRVNNGDLDSANDCLNIPNNGDNDDPLCDLVDKLEKIQKNTFVQASNNIKKLRNIKQRITIQDTKELLSKLVKRPSRKTCVMLDAKQKCIINIYGSILDH